MKDLDNFYDKQEESIREVFYALKEIILKQDCSIINVLKYGMPFFCYKGKMFCYLWIHKKLKQPYIGFVEGKFFEEEFLIHEKRSRMKIMLLDIDQDLPVERIANTIKKAISLYESGIVRL